jgi:hypothetical protein
LGEQIGYHIMSWQAFCSRLVNSYFISGYPPVSSHSYGKNTIFIGK